MSEGSTTRLAVSKPAGVAVALIVLTVLATSVFLARGAFQVVNSQTSSQDFANQTTTLIGQSSTTDSTSSHAATSHFSSSLSVGTSTAATRTTENTANTNGQCGANARLVLINSFQYCLIDVSNNIVVGAPGFSYFLNGSVGYMGVTFRTICPSNYSGCPGSNDSSTYVYAGDISFNMTFPDGRMETAGQVIGDSTYVLALSQHTGPRAGMLVEYGPSSYDTVTSNSNYHAFLLVKSP